MIIAYLCNFLEKITFTYTICMYHGTYDNDITWCMIKIIHDRIWCNDTLSFWYTKNKIKIIIAIYNIYCNKKFKNLPKFTLFSLTCLHFHIRENVPWFPKKTNVGTW